MTPPFRILIVEDEFITANLLRGYLQQLNYEVAGICKNALETFDFLKNNTIDFVILDIQIQGDKNGIWVANKIKEDYNLPFIYISANSDVTTVKEAVAANPLGYIVKPFQKNDVFTAIEVARKTFDRTQNSQTNQTQIPATENYMLFKTSNGYNKIFYEEILFVKAEKKYIFVHIEKEKLLLRYGIQEFKENLPEDIFVQIHRSYLVNVSKVEVIFSNSIKVGNFELPIGSSFKEDVKQLLNLS